MSKFSPYLFRWIANGYFSLLLYCWGQEWLSSAVLGCILPPVSWLFSSHWPQTAPFLHWLCPQVVSSGLASGQNDIVFSTQILNNLFFSYTNGSNRLPKFSSNYVWSRQSLFTQGNWLQTLGKPSHIPHWYTKSLKQRHLYYYLYI